MNLITETSICYAKDAPDCVVDFKDCPWKKIEEVNTRPGMPWNVLCECQCRHFTLFEPEAIPTPFDIVTCWSYLITTDDMLEIEVWIGQCEHCDKVYWTHQGPPFKRALAFVQTS